MEFLYKDILYNLLKHLDKNTSFNLLHTCTYLSYFKDLIMEKYIFFYENIKDTYLFDMVKLVRITTDDKKISILPPQSGYVHVRCDVFDETEYIFPETLNSLFIQCNEINSIDHLPRSLKSLYICCRVFDEGRCVLPNTLKVLHIKGSHYIILNKGYPNVNLISMRLETSYFNCPIDNINPSLKILTVESIDFNRSLDQLPPSLISLTIKSPNFNKQLTNLPKSLKHLQIDSLYFNKPIILNNLPNLASLEIHSYVFDQPLDNI